MTLNGAFDQAWQQIAAALSPTTKIVVAWSGGSDSTALVSLLQQLPAAQRPLIELAYFNHQLRVDSPQEEAFVRQQASAWQLPLQVGHWSRPNSKQPATEAQARTARYHFLAQVLARTGSHYLVTAHQQDDLLETILLRLARSGATTELPGLRPVTAWHDAHILRPLLGFSKQQLQAYLQAAGVPYYEDRTNATDFTVRNRLRHQVIPQLKEENAQVLAHASRFAAELQGLQALAQAQFVSYQRTMALIATPQRLSGQLPDGLTALPPSSQELFWQALWQQYFQTMAALKQGQLQELVQLTQTTAGQQTLALGADWRFVRDYQRFTIEHVSSAQPLTSSALPLVPQSLRLNQWTHYGGYQLGVFDQRPAAKTGMQLVTLHLEKLPQQWQLQPLTPATPLTLSDGHHQSLRRRLINRKVPQDQRMVLFGLVADKKVVWIANIYNYKLSNAVETAKIIYVLWQKDC